MGLDINGTKFLLYAKKHGVSFAETAMIGRQSMLIDAETLGRNLRLFGHDAFNAGSLIESGYAESFLKFLGADEIVFAAPQIVVGKIGRAPGKANPRMALEANISLPRIGFSARALAVIGVHRPARKRR